MRIGFVINVDKSLSLHALTGELTAQSFVRLTWLDGVTPTASAVQSTLWAMDECGVVMSSIARILSAMPEDDRKRPLAVLAAIEAAKGKQLCLDAGRRLRCVDTMRDDSTTYGAVDVPELTVEVDSVDKDKAAVPDEVASTEALKAITKRAGVLLMEDGTSDDLAERITLWKKAGRNVKKLSDGKAPTYLDRHTVWAKR